MKRSEGNDLFWSEIGSGFGDRAAQPHQEFLGVPPPGSGAGVVKGVTTGSTNQKAAYRSRGTNGPISVQQEVM